MNCLCCGKPLKTQEYETGWHKSCIKKFFGTAQLPEIEISNQALIHLVSENINRGYTVPGVQKKLSLHLSTDKKTKLTIVNYPTGYILKPQVEEFECLPQAEQLIMTMADVVGIPTVPHALVKDGENLAYITKRVDRIFSDKGKIQMLAMEDFCQLDLRLTQDKYRGSYERCAKIISKYSSRTGLDITELFMRLVFSYIVGNSDMHLKNFSLIETFEGSGEYVLSPAYDLLPVNTIMPEDKEQFALTMNGKKTNIRRKDFLVFAENSGLSKTAAEKMIDKLKKSEDKLISMCKESLIADKQKENLINLISARIQTL